MEIRKGDGATAGGIGEGGGMNAKVAARCEPTADGWIADHKNMPLLIIEGRLEESGELDLNQTWNGTIAPGTYEGQLLNVLLRSVVVRTNEWGSIKLRLSLQINAAVEPDSAEAYAYIHDGMPTFPSVAQKASTIANHHSNARLMTLEWTGDGGQWLPTTQGLNDNVVTGNYAASSGYGNRSSGNYSFTAGYACEAIATGAVAFGQASKARGAGSAAFGYSWMGGLGSQGQASFTAGQENRTDVAATGAACFGIGGRARLPGQFVTAVSQNGETQRARDHLSMFTEDATPTLAELYESAHLDIGAVAAWQVVLQVAALNTTSGEAATWFIKGGVRRDAAGNVALLGAATKEQFADAAMSGCDVDLIANNADKRLDVQVTGLAGTDISWGISVVSSQTWRGW
jgi:hypothetical protein